jgi:hypothetical protein
VGGVDVASAERGPGGGHGAEAAGVADLPACLRAGDAALGGDPIGGRAGPVGGMHLTGPERRGQLCHPGRQPGLLPAQTHHRLGQLTIRQTVGVAIEQDIDRRRQTRHTRRPATGGPDFSGVGIARAVGGTPSVTPIEHQYPPYRRGTTVWARRA